MNINFENLRSKIVSGVSQFDIISEMNDQEFSIAQTIKALVLLYSLSVMQAKELVSTHPAYSEIYSSFYDELSKLSDDFENGTSNL